MSPVALRLAAPGKLNLSLAVTGRRPDGYHELVGEMALLELADELLLLPGGAGLRVSGDSERRVPVRPNENLAWRGLLAGMDAEPLDCCLALEKRVPAMAGLGGGSSDAAAAWRLGRRWVARTDDPTPRELAGLARIGADVPFFAAGAARALVTGIGEHVEPLPARGVDETVLLVHPGFGLATAAVFAELHRSEWSRESDVPPPGRNALLAPALRLRPEIEDLMRLVLSAGLEPHMTGSGPTLYAMTDDTGRATAAAERLTRAGVRTTTTRLRPEPARIEVEADLEASLEEEES
jgi:4-diphosphocytidyl-2-C-methyl-D-erythritol kinase